MLREHKSRIVNPRAGVLPAEQRPGWEGGRPKMQGARAWVACHAGAILPNGFDAWQELLPVAKVRREGF